MRAIVAALTALILVGAVAGHAEAFDRAYPYVWKVNVGDDGYLWINVYANFTTEHGCVERWFARSKEPIGHEQTKAIMQIATASLLSQMPVHVWTVGCTGGGSAGYPILTRLQLQRP
jgi:hypothetical protein